MLRFHLKSPCTQHHGTVDQIDPDFLVCENHPVYSCINRIDEECIG